MISWQAGIVALQYLVVLIRILSCTSVPVVKIANLLLSLSLDS